MYYVLKCTRKFKQGDYTYSLMGDSYVHINNHKTNARSIIVPVSAMLHLLKGVKL